MLDTAWWSTVWRAQLPVRGLATAATLEFRDHIMSVFRDEPLVQMGVRNSILELVQGDITTQLVDAVVNAANRQLSGGGGVDGAIHAAAGPAVMRETAERYPGGCPTGSAVITTAGKLRASYVIHAVGPVWQGGEQQEPLLLASAYYRCFELAVQHRCDSIAFPAISTGAYNYPLEDAAAVAVDATLQFVTDHDRPHLVRFVLFDATAYETYERVLRKAVSSR